MPNSKPDWPKWIQREYSKHYSGMVAACSKILGDYVTAEDVVSAAFMRLRKQPASVAPYFIKLLTVACKRMCFSVAKKRQREWTIPDFVTDIAEFRGKDSLNDYIASELSCGPQRGEEDEAERRLHVFTREFKRLRPVVQRVFELKFLQGKSYAEISNLTGLTEGNVGFILSNTPQRIKRLVADKDV